MSHPPSEQDIERPLTVGFGDRLWKDGLWVLLAKLGGMAASLAVAILLSRGLSPASLGRYFVVYGVVSLCSVAGCLGMSDTATRFVAAKGRTSRPILLRVVIGALAACAVVSLLYIAGAWDVLTSGGAWTSAIRLQGTALLWIWLLVARQLVAGVLRGCHRVVKASVVLTVVDTSVAAGVFAAALVLGQPLSLNIAVGIGTLGTAVAVVIGVFWATRAHSPRESPWATEQSGVPGWRAIWVVSLPIFATQMADMGLTRGDAIVAGHTIAPAAIAFLGIGAQVGRLIELPAASFSFLLSPAIARLHAFDDLASLEATFRRSAAAASIAVVIGVLVLVSAGRLLVGFAYGQRYASAAYLAAIFGVGRLFQAASGPASTVLTMTNQQRSAMAISVSSTALAFLGGMVGGRWFGATGIAIAFAIAMAGRALGTTLAARVRLGIRCDAWPRALAFSKSS